MIVTLNFFSKNLKLHVRYFYGTSYNILRRKKSKMARVTARSIWTEMPHT